MLRDVISAVTEFMVRVLHSRSAVGIHAFAPLDALPCHACDQWHMPLGGHCFLPFHHEFRPNTEGKLNQWHERFHLECVFAAVYK
jgi:hypothetical protein